MSIRRHATPASLPHRAAVACMLLVLGGAGAGQDVPVPELAGGPTFGVRVIELAKPVATMVDLDGDGRDDLVEEGFAQGSGITWRPGLPGGGFGQMQVIGPALTPGEKALNGMRRPVDWDADGDMDLVTMDVLGNTRLFVNDGSAHFSVQSLPPIAGSGFVRDFAVADMDGDALVDIVAFRDGPVPFTDGLLVVQAHGSASTLGPPVTVPFGAVTFPADARLFVEHLDADTSRDIVIAVRNEFAAVYLNDGAGHVAPGPQPTIGGDFSEWPALHVGDVSGDGVTDLIVTRRAVWLGVGDGTFAAPVLVESFDENMALADVTEDGVLDLLGTIGDGSEFIVRRGGAALFSDPAVPSPGVADFLEVDDTGMTWRSQAGTTYGVYNDTFVDGHPHLRSFDVQADATVALDGGFVDVDLAGLGLPPTARFLAVLSDPDGDGDDDLLFRVDDDTVVTVFFEDGVADSLGTPFETTPGVELENHAVVADFNDDGLEDVVIPALLRWSVLHTNGTQDVLDRGAYTLGGETGGATWHDFGFSVVDGDWADGIDPGFQVAELDGDGRAEVVLRDGPRLSTYLSGSGPSPRALPPSRDTAVGDLDGDGQDEVLVLGLGPSDQTVHVIPTGSLVQPMAPTSFADVGAGGNGNHRLVTGEFTGDGDVDAVVYIDSGSSLSLRLLPGNGDGTLAPGVQVSTAPALTGWLETLEALDVDVDGDQDLVFTLHNPASVVVALSDGAGSFTWQAPVVISPFVSSSPLAQDSGIVVRDVTADGRPDIVAAEFCSRVTLMAGLPGGGFGPLVVLDDVFCAQGGGVTVVDVDLDGVLDVVASTGLSDGLRVIRGLGGGSFAPAETVPRPSLSPFLFTEAFDLVPLSTPTGDALVALPPYGGTAVIFPAGTAATGPDLGRAFQVSEAFPPSPFQNEYLAVDVVDDGLEDLVIGRRVIMHKTEGRLGAPTFLAEPVLAIPAIGDIDQDGEDEILIGSGSLPQPWEIVNVTSDGSVTLSSLGIIGSGMGVGDLDLDGDCDVVAVNQGEVRIFHQDTGGVFSQVDSIDIAQDSSGIALIDVADIDGNGWPEILLDIDGFLVDERKQSVLRTQGGLVATTPTSVYRPGEFGPLEHGSAYAQLDADHERRTLVAGSRMLEQGLAEPPNPSLGRSLAGETRPWLYVSSALREGSPISLDLYDFAPHSTVLLIIGLSNLSAPLKGGTLVPAPFVTLTLPTDGDGALAIPPTPQPAFPAGFPFYFQGWSPDPSGPAGFVASNSVWTEAAP